MAREDRDLQVWQNELVRTWARRLVKPPQGTGEMTQAELGKLVGLSQSGISSFLRGRQGTSFPVGLRIAQLAGEDPFTLLPPSPKPRESGTIQSG